MDADKISNDIDNLLERYLHLADQYQALREQLNASQSTFYQYLTKANLDPNRGILNYGQDRYDGRMQAIKLCHIKQKDEEIKETENSTEVPKTAVRFRVKDPEDERKDPIKMFAALPPASLRSAQAESSNILKLAIRLVEVDSEMKEIEIRVRRGRKYLLKHQEGGLLKDSHDDKINLHEVIAADIVKPLQGLGLEAESAS
ncbi:hypothetical protein B0O99DRAFT_523413 [Bisporella sp. PMI_857]|nr:hypothetical protein B0O99DRAFT_523413 [Bisporella sp. PMI_857]